MDMGVEPKIWENPQIIHLFIGFSPLIINHPFWGVKNPLFLEGHTYESMGNFMDSSVDFRRGRSGGPRIPTWAPGKWEIPNYKPYIVGICGVIIPKNPEVEHNKYHMYNVRDTPNCALSKSRSRERKTSTDGGTTSPDPASMSRFI